MRPQGRLGSARRSTIGGSGNGASSSSRAPQRICNDDGGSMREEFATGRNNQITPEVRAMLRALDEIRKLDAICFRSGCLQRATMIISRDGEELHAYCRDCSQV